MRNVSQFYKPTVPLILLGYKISLHNLHINSLNYLHKMCCPSSFDNRAIMMCFANFIYRYAQLQHGQNFSFIQSRGATSSYQYTTGMVVATGMVQVQYQFICCLFKQCLRGVWYYRYKMYRYSAARYCTECISTTRYKLPVEAYYFHHQHFIIHYCLSPP
jgi:hypothetical protein